MFEVLLASRTAPAPSPASSLAALSLHGLAIAGAIALTREVAQATPPAVSPMVAFHVAAPTPPTAPAAATPPARATPRGTPGGPQPAPEVGPSPALAAIEVPTMIPSTLPGVDVEAMVRGVAGGAPAVPGHLGRGEPGALDPRTALPRRVTEVDEPATWLRGPMPRYPEGLRAAGIPGAVRLRFIVGLDGRAETGSVAVLEASHPAFVAPAMAAIEAAVFRPARHDGQPVRQIVEQRIRFAVAPVGATPQ